VEAIEAVRVARPEVVLLDIQLPDIDGFQVAAALAGDADPPIIVLISSRGLADYGHRVETSGARGFIAKAELSREALLALLQSPERTPL
jgi:CheY-like chemotaxis protein